MSRWRDVFDGVWLGVILTAVAAVMLWLFVACRAPDRWSLEAGRTHGDLEIDPSWNSDLEATTLTVGISGPLTAPPLRVERPAPTVQVVDLQPVIDELVALRASLDAREEPPSAVQTGATQAGVLSLVGVAILGAVKGYAAWKVSRA